ncbi:zinc ABC transporter solute-binding protein [Candidatus Fermentibacteria bacterium]|nr:zinc ABC transporter solute-binding protein [Candidatus Fermentibacteria bacterium]
MKVCAMLFALALLVSCREAGDKEGLVVGVSIAPQAWVVEGIAGESAEVVVCVPAGADPHSYEPGPEVMRALSEADLYLTIGLPFEDQWLPRLRSANPDMRVEQMDAGLPRLMADGHGHIHSDGDPAEAEYGHPDPHVWMSCSNMRRMARNAAAVLDEIAPETAPARASNLARTLAEIDSVEARVRAILAEAGGRAFIALHPAYAYFADEFGLEQIALEVEGAEPTPSQLAEIIDLAGESGASAVVVSPGFATGAAEAVSMELGIPVVPHDQLSTDWPGSMESLASIIAEAR